MKRPPPIIPKWDGKDRDWLPPKVNLGPRKDDKGPALSGLTPTAYRRLMSISKKPTPDMRDFHSCGLNYRQEKQS